MIYMYVFNSIDSAYLHFHIDDIICLLIDIFIFTMKNPKDLLL